MSTAGARGLILAAPASGSGKTLVAIGLIAALRRAGHTVAAAKAGPDYIDSAFLTAAAGAPAVNLDSWAMRPQLLRALAGGAGAGADLLLVEGVMGLFDGAAGGQGSTAKLARALGLPVVLVIDASRQAQSAAALAHGFATFDPALAVAGVIFNRVAGARHERLMREAFAASGLAVLGAVPRTSDLELPSRHLGLVQAGETGGLDAIIAAVGELVAASIDLDALTRIACAATAGSAPTPPLPPPGQRIALAGDAAFGFAYEHLVAGWRAAGAEVVAFSPLADEPPDARADAVWLPGGYPELHAGRLAANSRFMTGLREAAEAGTTIHGECGGYMVLGQGLTDAGGTRHPMAGLLDLETTFAARGLALGYRRARARRGLAFAPAGSYLRGHEFHYATTVREAGEALFDLEDAEGNDLGSRGLVAGRVSGSFLHVIDTE